MRLHSLLALATVSLAAAAAYDKDACNNSKDLCSKSYSAIWHMGAHDAAFVKAGSNANNDAGNQYYDVTDQLNAGTRLIQSQIHDESGKRKLCHTSCELYDAGTLGDWLKDIGTWMAEHTSEVVTILLVNDDKISATDIESDFKSANLSDLAYTPTAQDASAWPTLQEMIDQDKRLVVFLTSEADTSTSGLINEWDYIFETAYEISDPSNYTCYADRPSSVKGEAQLATAVSSRMGLMNHFLYQIDSSTFDIMSPNDSYSKTLNSDSGTGNLADSISNCTSAWGKSGGFILMDFTSEGSPIDVVDKANNVTGPVNRVDWPKDADTGSSTSYGWSAVKALSQKVKDGTEVAMGLWVISAGNWVGVVAGDAK